MRVIVYRPHDQFSDCAAVALDEEGNELGWHISSSLGWAKVDMARHIPEGAETVWCIGRESLQAEIDAGRIRGITFDKEPA